MSKLDLSKPIRRKSDGAKCVVLEAFADGTADLAVRTAGGDWAVFFCSVDYLERTFENAPDRVERWFAVDAPMLTPEAGYVEVQTQLVPGRAINANLKLTFEGDKLVAAEVLK